MRRYLGTHSRTSSAVAAAACHPYGPSVRSNRDPSADARVTKAVQPVKAEEALGWDN